ncbi:MAG: glycosyltransferase family 2 protein [Gemmatimonadaceae bacterium]|nr:glycosyltransferase family 2 protein [Gemmatimonadaceae bacterium]
MSSASSRSVRHAPAFAVVVPFYNEARGMQRTLDALSAQHDADFALVLVDNASTDESFEIATRFASARGSSTVVIREPLKGTGAAADTGFRHAIHAGARWIARTDADCLPHAHWVRNLRRAMCDDGLEFVAGRIEPRTDEGASSLGERVILRAMIWIAEHAGRVHRRGAQFKYPYFMAAGNNLAITADLYERSGGFPRSAIEQLHEDRVLSEKVRTMTTRAAVRRDVIVYNSVRRVHAYGYLNTLRWYHNHGYRPAVVDVR